MVLAGEARVGRGPAAPPPAPAPSLSGFQLILPSLTLCPRNSGRWFLSVRATDTSSGAAVNSASVAPSTLSSDTNPANNTARATVVVGTSADLGISKSASPNVILYAQTTVFTLTVTNAELNAATAATVWDNLPSGLPGMLLSSSASGGGTLTASAVSSTQFNRTLTLPVGASV